MPIPQLTDLDIYCSTLSGPIAPNLVVGREYGLISATFTRAKQRRQANSIRQWVTENAREVRACAQATHSHAIYPLALRPTAKLSHRCKSQHRLHPHLHVCNSQAESARALAMANLRAKAKRAGANAILGVKVDIEGDSLGMLSYTLVVATGTAVVLNATAQGIVINPVPGQCLYAGVYEPIPDANTMARA